MGWKLRRNNHPLCLFNIRTKRVTKKRNKFWVKYTPNVDMHGVCLHNAFKRYNVYHFKTDEEVLISNFSIQSTLPSRSAYMHAYTLFYTRTVIKLDFETNWLNDKIHNSRCVGLWYSGTNLWANFNPVQYQNNKTNIVLVRYIHIYILWKLNFQEINLIFSTDRLTTPKKEL